MLTWFAHDAGSFDEAHEIEGNADSHSIILESLQESLLRLGSVFLSFVGSGHSCNIGDPLVSSRGVCVMLN